MTDLRFKWCGFPEFAIFGLVDMAVRVRVHRHAFVGDCRVALGFLCSAQSFRHRLGPRWGPGNWDHSVVDHLDIGTRV